MYIDALQYVAPSETVFHQMRAGKVDAVHITVGYHEDFDGVLANLQTWNHWFETYPDLIVRATNTADIQTARSQGKTAILFGLQNPLAFGADLRRVEILYQLGIRFCQLTYNQQSLLGAGCFEPHDSGLTVFGREVIDEMNRLGMIIDLSHAGHKTTMQAIEYSTRPVTVTHANADAWHKAPRNLHHDVLQALSDRGGMMGFSLYPHHLAQGSACTLDEFCAMVLQMAETYGDTTFGIGSDLCQGQPDTVVNWMRNGHWRKTPGPAAEFPKCPTWFENNTHFPGIADGLQASGLNEVQTAGIMGANWFNFLQNGFSPK